MPNFSGVWTLQQQLQAKAANNWPVPVPIIGSALGGGFFAGQISTTGNGIANFNLVVAPVSSGQQSSIRWRLTNTLTPGTESVIDGPANSAAMNDANHPAAQFCEGLSIGGFSDWYMPAQNELEVCYYNLKPTTENNTTSYGINANAVPSRGSNYTAGTPAQTSAAAFQSGGAEPFAATGKYWNSTSLFAYFGRLQYFNNGYQQIDSKVTYNRVRAIRRVAV